MLARWMALPLAGILLLLWCPAEAATWSGQYVRQLPDTAFASVETAPDGTKVRHLPHHDADRKLDLPHLCSALGRVHQVKWVDPANAEAAQRHLQDHFAALGRNPCQPGPRSPR